MSPLTVLVDGNNLFQTLDRSGRDHPERIETFLQRLELAAVSKDWEVTVIFDGPERFLPREKGPLVVRYAKGRTADTLIERQVYQAADRASMVVVTRDRAEADLVLGLGARVWSPGRLLEELAQ